MIIVWILVLYQITYTYIICNYIVINIKIIFNYNYKINVFLSEFWGC